MPDGRSSRLSTIGLLLAGAILCAAYVVPWLLSPIEGDLARDLYHGYRIATGQEWPVAGPKIGEGWHVGPAWYYLLGFALLAFQSITGAVTFVGLLAALKVPLAWRLGREWVDARFGLAWAILLVLPGVASFESIWVAHPSLVAVASLAVAFALWRAVERHSFSWMYAACLGFGIALHAHPTTLPLGLLLAIAFLRIKPAGARQWWNLFLCVALVLLPFASLLVDAPTQARDFAAFARDVAAATASIRFSEAIPVVANIFWHVPNLVVDTYLGDAAIVTAVWRIFLATLHVVVLAGVCLALMRPGLGLRRLAAGALAYTLFSALVIFAVRSDTRFYMVYALMPSIALVQAVGLTAFARSDRSALRLLASLLLGAALVSFVAVASARFTQSAQGVVRLPALFGPQMNLRTGPKAGYMHFDSLPLWDIDALGRALCAAGDVRAFGDLTIVIDSQFNVPARVHCGDRSRVVLGGQPGRGEAALFLLPSVALPDDHGMKRYGALRLGEVESIPYPGRGVALASGDTYPARPLCGPASVHGIDFTARSAASIVVAAAVPAQCPITLRRVTVGGREAGPTRHSLSYFLRAPSQDGDSDWHLEIETGDIGAVQIFTLPPATPTRPRG